jgi:hypothetical protein
MSDLGDFFVRLASVLRSILPSGQAESVVAELLS